MVTAPAAASVFDGVVTRFESTCSKRTASALAFTPEVLSVSVIVFGLRPGFEIVKDLFHHGMQGQWLQVEGYAPGFQFGDCEQVFDQQLQSLRVARDGLQEARATSGSSFAPPASSVYLDVRGGVKDDPDVATRFLQTIARNAERLQLLIEDLLTVSELNPGA